MSDNTEIEIKNEKEFLLVTFGIVLFVCILAITIISFYVYKFQDLKLSVNPADWGAFGDYVGGLVNPAAGVATVILVFFTLAVQRIELRASLKELKIANTSAALMSFEQSLFAWLSNYHSLINAIEAQHGTTGRKAMSHWYQSKLRETLQKSHRCELKPV